MGTSRGHSHDRILSGVADVVEAADQTLELREPEPLAGG
jgi:hypothetical protein